MQSKAYRVLHKWQNEVTTSKTVIFQHFKHNNMTILHNILGDLLYSFLGSPILVFLEHVLEVATLHVDARSDQQVLRHPPHSCVRLRFVREYFDFVSKCGQNQC